MKKLLLLAILSLSAFAADNIVTPPGTDKAYLSAADGKNYPLFVAMGSDGAGHVVPLVGDGSLLSINTNTPSIVITDPTGPAAYIDIPDASTATTGLMTSTVYNTLMAKQDALGFTPVNKDGDTMSGSLTSPGINLTAGASIKGVNSVGGLPLDELLTYPSLDNIILLGNSVNTNGVGLLNTKYFKGQSFDGLSYLDLAGVTASNTVVLSSPNANTTNFMVGGLEGQPAMKLQNGGNLSLYHSLRIGQDGNTIFGGDIDIVSSQHDGQDGTGGIGIASYRDSDIWGGFVYGARYRGTKAAPLAVQNGDVLMEYGGIGWDGANAVGGGELMWTVDSAVATNTIPSRLEMTVTATTGETKTGLKIDSSMVTTVYGPVKTPTFQLGTPDAFGNSQIWDYGLNSKFRMGSLGADGDPTGDISTEGMVFYGQNVQGDPMNSTNATFSYARIKPTRFGIYNSTLAGADYIWRVDGTSLYLKDNSFNKTFEVTRSTGAIKTSMGAGVVQSDSSGNLTSSSLSSSDILNSSSVTGTTTTDALNALTTLASTSTTGLLSSTNFNQFNNKPSGGGGLYGLAYWSSTSNLSALTELKITTSNPKRITMGGAGTPATLSNVKINSYDTVDGYLQNNIQNLSTGVSASSDWIATADNGTDTTNYIDMGINGSGYSSATWTMSGALDAYLYSQSSHLTVGTASAKQIRFHTGGTLAANERMRIDENGLVGIGTGTATLTQKFEVSGNVKSSGGYILNTTGSQPTCDSSIRGMMWYVQGSTGVADTFQICMKSSGDTYSWVTK